MDILIARRLKLMKQKLFTDQVRNPSPTLLTSSSLTSFYRPCLSGVKNAFIEQYRFVTRSTRTSSPRMKKNEDKSSRVRSIQFDTKRISNSLELLKNGLDNGYREIFGDLEKNIFSTDIAVIKDINEVCNQIQTLSSMARNKSNNKGHTDTKSKERIDGLYAPKLSPRGVNVTDIPIFPYETEDVFDSLPYKDRNSSGICSFDSGVYIESDMNTGQTSFDCIGIGCLFPPHMRTPVSKPQLDHIGKMWLNWDPEKTQDDSFVETSLFNMTLGGDNYNYLDTKLSPYKLSYSRSYDTENKPLLNKLFVEDTVGGDTCKFNGSIQKNILQTNVVTSKSESATEVKATSISESPYDGYSAILYDKCFFNETTLNEWFLKITGFFSPSSWKKYQAHASNVDVDDNKEFREDMVRSHNAFRVFHGSPEISQSDDLNKDAQMWADIIAEKGYVQYSELPGRGENVIFLDTNGLKPSGAEVTKHWYGQLKNYDFNNPRWQKNAIHFTQLVWRSSTEIGIGLAKLKDHDKIVIVAQYKPVGNGNMPGEFRKNVLRPQ